MAAKDKWVNIREKELNKLLGVSQCMGSENADVIMLNAVVDYFKTVRHVGMNEDDIQQLSAFYNRYDAYYKDDIITAQAFNENFTRWTGIKIAWFGVKKVNLKVALKALRSGAYDRVLEKRGY